MTPMESWNYNIFLLEALKQIKSEFIEKSIENEFDLWFDINYIESQQLKIIASLPSNFIKDKFISKGYANLIENKLFELTGQHITLEIIVKTPTETKNSSVQIEKPSVSSEKIISSNQLSQERKHPQLLARYTFENFVKGDNNAFAFGAAQAVSKNPGQAYNPVLIYGGVGLGKTHLMQAIGNSTYKELNSNVICITAETFTNEFINSINTNSTNKFKNKYRHADVLLIDDIHFLMGKKETQEELFYTFEALYNNNKQMVFTCDRPVSELKDISERLRSRFERGLNVDLLPPQYETRRAILEKKASQENLSILPSVIDLIAKNVCTNVRDLEAALTKIQAYAELVGKEVTVEIAQQQLRDMFSSPKQGNITIEIIQKVVAEKYGLSLADIKGKKRNKNIILPRQFALYIARELTEYSTTELGIEFGGKDHTTVMHSCEKVEKMLISDPTVETTIQMLIRSIKDYKK